MRALAATVVATTMLAMAGCGTDGSAERTERPSVTATIDGVASVEGGSIVVEGKVSPATATIEADGRPANVGADGTFSVTADAPREGTPASITIEGRAPGHWPYSSTVSIPASELDGPGATARDRPKPKQPRGTSPVTLQVQVYDDTTSNSPSDLEVWARGHGSFYPDTSYGSDSADMTIAGRKLHIYPDGRGGSEIVVKIRPPATLIEGSARDALLVDVTDSDVGIVGSSVPGNERRFPR